MSRCPSSPTRTGQVPTFLQLAAKSLSVSGRGKQRDESRHPVRPERYALKPASATTPGRGRPARAVEGGCIANLTLILNTPSSAFSLRTSTSQRVHSVPAPASAATSVGIRAALRICFSTGKLNACAPDCSSTLQGCTDGRQSTPVPSLPARAGRARPFTVNFSTSATRESLRSQSRPPAH